MRAAPPQGHRHPLWLRVLAQGIQHLCWLGEGGLQRTCTDLLEEGPRQGPYLVSMAYLGRLGLWGSCRQRQGKEGAWLWVMDDSWARSDQHAASGSIDFGSDRA